jgi:hypothetical protein
VPKIIVTHFAEVQRPEPDIVVNDNNDDVFADVSFDASVSDASATAVSRNFIEAPSFKTELPKFQLQVGPFSQKKPVAVFW